MESTISPKRRPLTIRERHELSKRLVGTVARLNVSDLEDKVYPIYARLYPTEEKAVNSFYYHIKEFRDFITSMASILETKSPYWSCVSLDTLCNSKKPYSIESVSVNGYYLKITGMRGHLEMKVDIEFTLHDDIDVASYENEDEYRQSNI